MDDFYVLCTVIWINGYNHSMFFQAFKFSIVSLLFSHMSVCLKWVLPDRSTAVFLCRPRMIVSSHDADPVCLPPCCSSGFFIFSARISWSWGGFYIPEHHSEINHLTPLTASHKYNLYLNYYHKLNLKLQWTIYVNRNHHLLKYHKIFHVMNTIYKGDKYKYICSQNFTQLNFYSMLDTFIKTANEGSHLEEWCSSHQ